MFHHYLATALRHFRQHAVTTSINVVCLALGLTCFILAWGMAAYFGRSDHYHSQAERTYILTSQQVQNEVTLHLTPWLLASHLQADFPQLQAVARVPYPQELPISADGASSFASLTYADAQFLEIFDLPFVAGDRTALSRPNSAVISAGLAQRLFGTENALGRRIRLSGRQESAVVTGVVGSMPRPSHISTDAPAPLGLHFEVLLSMNMHAATQTAQRWDSNWYFTYVVLRPDGSLTIDALNDQLEAFANRHVSADQQGLVKFGARPVADFSAIGMDTLVRADSTGLSSTMILEILGGLVLLVACLNYANLAMAQAATRAREVAMRKVVGANHWQVTLQHFFESALLTCAALLVAVLCLGLAMLAVGTATFTGLTILFASMPTFWVFLATLLILVSILVGAYPALILSRVRPANALRGARIRSAPRFMATLLIACQFGSASFLTITVFVMLMQNQEIKRAIWNPASDPLVVIANDLGYSDVDPQLLYSELLRRPGISAVSGVHRMPWSIGGNADELSTSADASAAQMTVQTHIVTPDFFTTLQVPVIAGRAFESDRAADVANMTAWQRNDPAAAPDYNIVIDRDLVQRLGFASPNAAVGKVIYRRTSQTGSTPPQRLHIIGVVEETILRPINLGYANFYMMNPRTAVVPVVRIAKHDVAAGLASIDAAWRELAPEVPIKRRFADEQFEQSFQFLEVVSGALAILAAFASIIAAMGLVGMALHVTRGRTHEIGIRKTLGASVGQILLMLLRSFSKPVVIANLIAWPLAFLVMRAYLSIFARSAGLSLTPFVLSLGITLLIAWLAVAAQATRAARLKPATVLRYE